MIFTSSVLRVRLPQGLFFCQKMTLRVVMGDFDILINHLYKHLIKPNINNKKTFLLLDDGTEISYEDFISNNFYFYFYEKLTDLIKSLQQINRIVKSKKMWLTIMI